MATKREKDTTDKIRFDLIGAEFDYEFAEVLTKGAAKYEENAWRSNKVKHYIAAARRHLNAIQEAIETNDESKLYDYETGNHHSAHLACNAMFLYYLAGLKISDKDVRSELKRAYIREQTTGMMNMIDNPIAEAIGGIPGKD